MLHAPTAETKAETTQSKSAPVSLPTRKSKAPSSLLRQPSLDQVTVHLLLKLQRTIGNQAVLTTLRSQKTNTTAQPLSEPGFDHNFSRISGLSPQQTVLPQTKLKVSQPGDAYEQEAEQVAEQIMRIADEESSPSDGVEEAENFLPHKQASEPGTNLATPSPTVLARQPLQEASSPSTETNPPLQARGKYGSGECRNGDS